MLFDLNLQYEVQREVNRKRVQDADKDRLLRSLPRPNSPLLGRWLRSLLFFL
jgi:hypothetical protein